MAEVGITILQEEVASEFGSIVSPTHLNKISWLELVDPPAWYSVFWSTVNLGFIDLDDVLQILAKADNVSPKTHTKMITHACE